jgi:small subunit ribosomal protein S20
MANHKSAIKRIRQDAKKRLRNRSYKSRLKSEIKKLVATDSKQDAELQFRKVESLLDKLANKRIIHPNAAANRKSKLVRSIANLS